MLKNSNYFKFWLFYLLSSKHFNFFYKFCIFDLFFKSKINNSQLDMLGVPLGVFKSISKNYQVITSNYNFFVFNFYKYQLLSLFVLNCNFSVLNEKKFLLLKKTNLLYFNPNVFSIHFLFKINYFFFFSNTCLFKKPIKKDILFLGNIPLRNFKNF